MMRRWGLSIVVSMLTVVCWGQTFSLVQKSDSLYLLMLTVGVIKATRFYPEKGRRLFIFKNYEGLVRPMWLGSKLGGILQDFHFRDGMVRSLETNVKGQFTVAEYRWDDFGMAFERYLIRDADEAEARRIFEP